jgi:hypothetical protein
VIPANHSVIWRQEREPETKHGESEHGATPSLRYVSEIESANEVDRQAGSDDEIRNPHPMPLESTSIRVKKVFDGKLYKYKLCMMTRCYHTDCNATKFLPV